MPAAVLVFTPSQAVADWAAEPVKMGFGQTYCPIVVGPDGIPRIEAPDVAIQVPQLALLSALAHGNRKHSRPVLEACIESWASLDEGQVTDYHDLLLMQLNAAVRKVLHTMLKERKRAYLSDTFNDLVDQGKRQTLLKLAQLKFGELTAEQETRVRQADGEMLERWTESILTAETADDLFN
ncbi:MAG: hypothetical protein ACE366_13490 [Bradymonadia bacterium]